VTVTDVPEFGAEYDCDVVSQEESDETRKVHPEDAEKLNDTVPEPPDPAKKLPPFVSGFSIPPLKNGVPLAAHAAWAV